MCERPSAGDDVCLVRQGSPMPTRAVKAAAGAGAGSMAAQRKAPSAILIPGSEAKPPAPPTAGSAAVPDTPLSSWDSPTPTPAKGKGTADSAGAGASPSGSDWDAESPALPSLGASAQRSAGQGKDITVGRVAADVGDESSDWDESPAASKRTSKERRRDGAEQAETEARKDDELLRVSDASVYPYL